MSRLRDQQGGVLVLAAFIIPAFLILTALVLDVGNWHAHTRQLQNRADAGALAAGVELARNWPACITDTTAQDAVTAAAKRFAGDPTTGTVDNIEVANQLKLNVQVNSTGYAGPDHSDGASGPCQPHPATLGPENESNITPLGGTWVDVKVREQDTKSFAGTFGIDLLQNHARARVELLETAATNEFIPIAIPEQSVVKARIRFVNMCNGAELASSVLKPLDVANQTVSGLSLWGPDPTASPANPNGTAPTVTPGTVSMSTPSTVPVPNTAGASGCGDSMLDHTPIRVELRLAGRLDIDLTDATTCGALQAMGSADCYPEISKIRVYQPTAGLFGDRPQIRDVTFSPSGTGPCTMDAYYSRSTATPNCTFDASVFMDWGSRPGGADATFEATIEVDGSAARALTGPTPQGTWTAAQVPIGALGPDWVKVSWRYELRSGSWGPGGSKMTGCTAAKPCEQKGTTTVHAANLGNEPGGADSPTEVVGAVKLTQGPAVTSQERHSAETNATLAPYVTIGLRTSFQTGDWSVLRLDSGGGGNYSIICDPYWPQPSSIDAEAAFYFGCQPPYAKNDTTTSHFWWDTGTKQCPISKDWWKNNPPTGTWPNQTYVNTPWKCLLIDTGGNGQTTGDGIALATENCTASKVDVGPAPGPGVQAKCKSSDYTCYNEPTYFGTGPTPSPDDPRLVKLFVVPWNAYKFAGPKDVVPVLRLAGFYITSWRFNGRQDPCWNRNAQTLAEYTRLGATGDKLSGYFVKEVETAGVGNTTRQCNPTAVELCTVTLTR